ncbi:tRNA-modifying protein YgfZ [Neptunicella marina]|uniref:tRNA-modifying protein YgfZ n=1 Tax=Neptunicella marina TaxID=2125989 RepID=A0A8J6IUE7_9ALTE|nr:tRNA-modifying protein YgfZ [Neptunicella marina]MBC3766876.1 tRNA-modifying protein YgfZ [Neptunicella marina]
MTDFIQKLDHLGVISLAGQEKESYLQGQITADVKQLHNNNALTGCHCDAKGKTWSIFYAINWQDKIHLITHLSGLTGSFEAFRKFAVFSKVDIENNSAEYGLIGGSGDIFASHIEQFFGEIPSQHLATVANHEAVVICIEGNEKRWLVMINKDAEKRFINQSPDEHSHWQVLDIQNGIAHIEAANCNEFVPQMLNMQALGAISFTKGCYMGQEVVARTKYLGKNKRAAFILHSQQNIELEAGETLELSIEENWRRGGTVLSCATLENQTWLLAVLANDTQTGAVLRSKAHPEYQFTVLPLPYSLEL